MDKNNLNIKNTFKDRTTKKPKQYREKNLLKPMVQNNEPDSIRN